MPKSNAYGALKRCKYVDDDEEVFKEVDEFEERGDWFVKGRCRYGNEHGKPKKLQGTDIDVMSLLSNRNGNAGGVTTYLVKGKGEIVSLEDAVIGKYLVICCVSLPMDEVDKSEPAWCAMIDTYIEKSASFEMVVAVTINPNTTNQHRVFNQFISSRIPCLAIPFPDIETRNSICSFIGFPTRKFWISSVSAIVVSPTGRILRHTHTSDNFFCYGSDWFTRSTKEIGVQDAILRSRLDPFQKRFMQKCRNNCWNFGSGSIVSTITTWMTIY